MEYMHQLFRPFWTVVLDFGGTWNKSYWNLKPLGTGAVQLSVLETYKDPLFFTLALPK